jgi:hypothetical protein
MKKIRICAAVGILTGFIIGEFFPRLFHQNIDSLGDDLFGGPFSQYRNHLALDYCLAGILIGALVGFIWDKLGSKERS